MSEQDRKQMVEQLEKYRQSNGAYDVAAIIRDEQPSADGLSVTFGAFFGDGDDDTPATDSELVALARELNEAQAQANEAQAQVEIAALTAELESATGTRRNQVLNRLVELGAGQWIGDGDALEFEWNQRHGTEYDDQADFSD